jgi:hypothetical protein
MVSSSRLSGRGGRGGGGPEGLTKGTVTGRSEIVGLDRCGRRVGREMQTLRPCERTSDERELQAERSGVMVGQRGGGSTGSTGICGIGGGGGDDVCKLLLRKSREPTNS